mmetsp:Transcript_71190/g.141152  ORF Transcript_71190/g.141152 Transcript_71190/m.141152 type:complete len:145 (-) Transcript_71190:513-947(-)
MASHFLIKWLGYPMEECTWESADVVQAAAPHIVAAFKQNIMQERQQHHHRQPPSQMAHMHMPPPPQVMQSQPSYMRQQQQHHQGRGEMPHQESLHTPYRDGTRMIHQSISQHQEQSDSPLRPDQEADAAAAAIRRRNMGSNPFG